MIKERQTIYKLKAKEIEICFLKSKSSTSNRHGSFIWGLKMCGTWIKLETVFIASSVKKKKWQKTFLLLTFDGSSWNFKANKFSLDSSNEKSQLFNFIDSNFLNQAPPLQQLWGSIDFDILDLMAQLFKSLGYTSRWASIFLIITCFYTYTTYGIQFGMAIPPSPCLILKSKLKQ